MELPVAAQSYHPAPQALVRALHRAEVMLARTLAEETDLGCGLALANAGRRGVFMANFVAEAHVPDGSSAESVVRRIQEHFAQAGVPCYSVLCAQDAWPTDLAAALRAAGYAPGPWASVQSLQRYRPPSRLRADLQVIPARAAYGQLRALYHEAARVQHGADEPLAAALADAQIAHLDEPRFEMLLARLDGRPVGVAGLITVGDIGIVDNVYTAPAHRRQGVASTLASRLIEQAARAGLKTVILEALEDSSAVSLYEQLGFVTMARHHKYQLP